MRDDEEYDSETERLAGTANDAIDLLGVILLWVVIIVFVAVFLAPVFIFVAPLAAMILIPWGIYKFIVWACSEEE